MDTTYDGNDNDHIVVLYIRHYSRPSLKLKAVLAIGRRTLIDRLRHSSSQKIYHHVTRDKVTSSW